MPVVSGPLREERSHGWRSDDEGSSFFAGCEKAGVPEPPACNPGRGYSTSTARSFSKAFAWSRETCICETFRRFAISVWETDS